MLRSLCVAFGLTCTVVAMVHAEHSAEDSAVTESFEDSTSDRVLPAGWNFFPEPRGSYTAAIGSDAHSGRKSLLIQGTGSFAAAATPSVKVDRTSRYAARGWVKVEQSDPSGAGLKIDYYADDGMYLGDTGTFRLNDAQGKWQLIAFTSSAAAFPDARKLSLVMTMNRGRVLFDDLELKAIEAPRPASSLLFNGDMETIIGERPVEWHYGTSDNGNISLTWSSDDPHQGWYCLRLVADAEWAAAWAGRIQVTTATDYVLNGFVRTRSGTAALKIDYYREQEYLGHTMSETATRDQWEQRTVRSQLKDFPEATHIVPVAVGLKKTDACFDSLLLQVAGGI